MATTEYRAAKREKIAGFALIASAALAILAANSALADSYDRILHMKFGPAMPRIGQFNVDYWATEGLMSLFFLLIGLEVKREWFEGKLASPEERRLPVIAAIGGMAIPALVYVMVIGNDPAHIYGWAIPAATDIAFAIGVLAILGRHAPASIKLLLVSIAIVDDVGAVAIIALFYTADLNVDALGAAVGVTLFMGMLSLLGVRRLWPYLAAFLLLWWLVLASGVHATIAGVLAALTIPLKGGGDNSPLKRLEHSLHPWVMFLVVPLFGFTSAGVELGGAMLVISQPIALAVMLGLFVGKQLGVFGAIWLAVRAGLANLPNGVRWAQIYGAALLCGIGFTMSLFIGALAFPGDAAAIDQAKVGTLAGSLLSALAGYALFRVLPETVTSEEDEEVYEELFARDGNGPKSA